MLVESKSLSSYHRYNNCCNNGFGLAPTKGAFFGDAKLVGFLGFGLRSLFHSRKNSWG